MVLKRAFYLLLASFALFVMPNAAGQERSSFEYEVKAAFLNNFVTFVDWPRLAFSSSNAPLRICIFGQDPFRGALERAIRDASTVGRPRSVQRVDDVARLKTCHVVFVGAAERARLGIVLDAMKGWPALTVGEFPGFLEAGGIVNLVVERNRVRFDVNLAAAEAISLKVSSKLLRLARTTRVPQQD
jgi:hypothetical protein